MSRASGVPVIDRAYLHCGRVAVVDAQGSFTYDELLDASSRIAAALLAGRDELLCDLREERVGFLMTPGFGWVAVLWGIWRAGGVAVPLPLNSANPEMEFLLDDVGASTLVCDAAAAAQ